MLDWNVVDGWMPSSSAAASTNGLKDEPGWRWASVARSNGCFEKSRPPTSALTWPLRGSIATIAPAGPFFLSVVLSASRAFFCIFRSIVV